MDIRTLMVVLVACNLMLSVFLFVAARVQKPYPGFYHWAFSCLAMALAFVFLSLRDTVPLWLSVAGGNLFLPLASVLRLVGLKKFFGRPPHLKMFWLAAALPALMLAALALGADDMRRGLLTMLYLDAFIFFTARELWLARDPQNYPLHYTMIGFYALSGLVLTVRDFDWLLFHGGSAMFHRGATNSALFLLQIIVDIAWVTFFFAINVQRKNAEIQLANRELAEAGRVKDRFLYVLGHDLRGPLGGLESALETYIDERAGLPDAERVKLLTMFLERSRAINRQLEGLIIWGRHQAGHEKFNPERLRLFDLVEKEMLNLSKEKSIVFHNDIDPDAEAYGDPAMLAGVFRQLLGNAQKFSQPGGAVHITQTTQSGSVQVCVADAGIGLPEEYLKGIFTLGAVKARWGTAGEPGTGLGLPLCAQYIASHGGRIWAESRPEGGASIKFTLPAAPAGA